MIKDKNAKPGLARQGDVIIEKFIGGIPAGARKKLPQNGYFVWARGEVSMHCHQTRAADGMECWETDDAMYLIAKDRFDIVHDEHETIPSEDLGHKSGELFTTVISIQSEYSPQEVKRVLD